ncbi:MAG: hypothetical protein DMG21_02685 [Acidobacteria bacterium]|nr:MAG: hypothetical protein DMG21_02685 [Acidobacteriota bacterium]
MGFCCPVCGYDGLTEPRYREGSGGSYEICPSCGFQFGVTDDDSGYTHERWRKKWIAEGMKWDKGRTHPPKDWNPVQQLKNIGVHLGSDSASLG